MKKIEHILVATDFSAQADKAVPRSAQLAKEHDAKLCLLHILPVFTFEALKRLMIDTPLETEQRLYNRARATLQERAAPLAREGISVIHHVAIARTHVEINQYAKSHHADLILIGDQGETFAQEFFLGTTASNILSKGSFPLLVVKQEPKAEYKHVLVPMDFSQPSLVALRVALKMTMQAFIHVLHVAEAPFEGRMKRTDPGEVDRHRYNLLSRAHPEMKKIIEDYAGGNARVSSIIEPGCAPAVILKHVQSLHIDLVVIGKRGETELDGALFGSVIKHVIYETSCDVLVVSQPDEQSGNVDPDGTHS